MLVHLDEPRVADDVVVLVSNATRVLLILNSDEAMTKKRATYHYFEFDQFQPHFGTLKTAKEVKKMFELKQRRRNLTEQFAIVRIGVKSFLKPTRIQSKEIGELRERKKVGNNKPQRQAKEAQRAFEIAAHRQQRLALRCDAR